MWLLPDEERAGIRRSLACPGVGHLHPADALEALSLGYLLGLGVGDGVVPVEDGGDGLRTVPQGEVHQVPPGHFQVRTAEPGVVGEAGLLRWQGVGTVHLRQVLGEHDAALQFLGARVGTLAEVDDGALLPPAVPRADDGTQLFVEDERPFIKMRILGVLCLEGKDIACGGNFEVMRCTFIDRGYSLPVQVQVIYGAVNLMLNDDGIGSYARLLVVGCNDARGVALGFRPVSGSVGMLARRVGEADGDAGATVLQERRLDAVDDGITILQGGGGDIDGGTVDHTV